MDAGSAFDWLSSELGTPEADIEQNQAQLEAARMAALDQACRVISH